MVQIAYARRPLARRNTRAGLTPLGPDQFEGYASLFNVQDGAGDSVAPGAFAASLRRRGPDQVRLLYHTARLGLRVLPPTPLQPQVTHNEALMQLDALLFLRLGPRPVGAAILAGRRRRLFGESRRHWCLDRTGWPHRLCAGWRLALLRALCGAECLCRRRAQAGLS